MYTLSAMAQLLKDFGEKGLHMNGQDSLVQPLFTDYYQITMCYAYRKAGTNDQTAIFDLFIRKKPFQGEFTIFAGLEDCLRFVENFKFTKSGFLVSFSSSSKTGTSSFVIKK